MKLKNYFTATEKAIWILSSLIIILSFLIFDSSNYLTLTASLLGVTSLIFCAKGNPFGEFLMVIFSVLYGVISFSFRYYGEMITYLCMTGPMSLFSLISWLKNPYNGNKSEVKVNKLSKKEIAFMNILTLFVTAAFYFILKYFNTTNLILSTVSVATSFAAVYMTLRRSEYFYLAYAANDTVLIGLWILAARQSRNYISVIICFICFLINDIYGFISWQKMRIRQAGGENFSATREYKSR